MVEDFDLKTLRHSAAHLAAQALTELYPDIKLTIGPATQEGFFYDFQTTKNLRETDLPAIEKRMLEIVKQDLTLTHKQISKEEARKLYKDNQFKLELIDEIPGDSVGLAQQGSFFDLCRGGHVPSTKYLKYFKLTGLSGSYWRAQKNNTTLQRLSGTAFFSQEEMDAYEKEKEEAHKYDHRRLGKQLDLYSFHEEGVGFPFFHPKGQSIVKILIDYMRHIYRNHTYQEISTPMMLTDNLWRKSGHYEFYKDNMYFSHIDEKTYAIKPMNCPGSILIYRERPRSYRELPLRLSEFGKVHRHELSGVLHGLFRVRAFTIDDTHIYCTLDQIEQEITNTINIITTAMKNFGFSTIKTVLSTKPDVAMGNDEIWTQATKSLKNALDASKIAYTIQEGEGAFYGPKIEFIIEDSMKREWQCGTIQLDFFQAENFDLSYISSGGTHKRPVIIHQAIYGSIERFFAILVEHHKGFLPFWLAPIQIRILTVSDKQKKYAHKVEKALFDQGIRVEHDMGSDTLSAQIKSAQLAKIPWMVIIGQKEADDTMVTVRYHNGKQEQHTLQNFLKQAQMSSNYKTF